MARLLCFTDHPNHLNLFAQHLKSLTLGFISSKWDTLWCKIVSSRVTKCCFVNEMKWNGIVSRINLLNCHAVRFMDVCTWITTGRPNGIDETYVDETPIISCAHIHWLETNECHPGRVGNSKKDQALKCIKAIYVSALCNSHRQAEY